MLREKNTQIGKLEHRLQKLEQSANRQHDLIYKANFGVQVYDTIPEAKIEPEAQLSPEQTFEKEIRDQEQARAERIKWTRRHRPSQLADVIAQEATAEHVQAARAAHPAQQVFETARKQVNGQTH